MKNAHRLSGKIVREALLFITALSGGILIVLGMYCQMASSRLSRLLSDSGSAAVEQAIRHTINKDMLQSLLFYSLGGVILGLYCSYVMYKFVKLAAMVLMED